MSAVVAQSTAKCQPSSRHLHLQTLKHTVRDFTSSLVSHACYCRLFLTRVASATPFDELNSLLTLETCGVLEKQLLICLLLTPINNAVGARKVSYVYSFSAEILTFPKAVSKKLINLCDFVCKNVPAVNKPQIP